MRRENDRDEDRDDYDDDSFRRRRRRRGMDQNSIVMSLVSTILGCVAFPLMCLCGPLGIAASGCALLTGGIGLKSENAKVLAIIGLSLGSLGVLIYVAALIFILKSIH
jgi:Flp pilus assembly protein TadB